ncbi:T9SS type A sorting domain-containing protein [Flavobacterium sp.]|uniref:T9SS type A sorting domain-containing protein n=1 Tax=Flavobacterium sp. TaxID=239 RepID=UPI00263524B8|nr:T9SS type A sorting domain-containing protein [Flavobacterium sp.]
MKSKLKLMFTIIFLSFNFIQMKGEVKVFLEQVRVNGVDISNCSSVNFGANNTINLTFKLRITKLATDNITSSGTFNLYLLRNANSTPKFINGLIVSNTSFGTNGEFWTGNFSATLQASDIDAIGSTFYGEYDYQTNSKLKTCIYPLTKTTPTFTLSPTSTSVACGDTSPRSFSVTATNIPAGASLSYVWSYSGWSGTSTNTNTITLAPFPGTGLPSNVTVQPILNNVNQAILSCSVNRAPFVSVSEISGPKGICSGSGNYSISNTAGQTVTWSLSNTAIGTLSNPSNTGVTVAFSGNGAQTLTATITNACGQIATVPFVINDGAPTFTSNAQITGASSLCSGATTFTLSNLENGQTVVWSLSNTSIATLSNVSNTQATLNFISNGSQTLTAVITNSCGQTRTVSKTFWMGKPLGLPSGLAGPSTVQSGAIASYSVNSALPRGATSFEWWLPFPYDTVAVFDYFGQNWQKIEGISSAGSSINVFTGYAGTSGLIQVMGANECGCGGARTISVTHDSGGGGAIARMPNPNDSNDYVVYPNPTSDWITIELKDEKSKTNKSTRLKGELFDFTGQVKAIVDEKETKAKVNVQGLQKGMYILKIYSIDKVETHQIAVE